MKEADRRLLEGMFAKMEVAVNKHTDEKVGELHGRLNHTQTSNEKAHGAINTAIVQQKGELVQAIEKVAGAGREALLKHERDYEHRKRKSDTERRTKGGPLRRLKEAITFWHLLVGLMAALLAVLAFVFKLV